MRFLISYLLLLIPCSVSADSTPASVSPNVKCVPSGSFCARSDPQASRTVVTARASGPVLWAIPRFFRYFDLSGDGNSIVALSDVGLLLPLDATLGTELVYIYRSGALVRTIHIGDLFTEMSELGRSRSHYTWGELLPLGAGDSAVIRLPSGEKVTYDLRTGMRGKR